MSTPATAESNPTAIKVLHVTETLPGGIATYLRELLPLQIKDASIAEVRVLAPLDQLSHLETLPDSTLHGYARSGRNLRSLWNLMLALRKQVAEFRPQVLHLHSSFAGTIGRVMRPWLPRGLRIVYCPHGWAFSRDDGRLSRLAYTWAERGLAPWADAWIAISKHELEVAREAGIRCSHAHLVYNGLGDSQQLKAAPVQAYDSAYLNLLFVGRHDRQKGLDILLSAMSQLPAHRVRLYIAGAGIINGGAKQEKADNIFWLGWLAGDELIAHYRACDAVVVPSRWEGFGLVAIEAMRESRAVIASRRGALPEIIEDQRCGRLFEPDDPAGLAIIIDGLQREVLEQWGAAARQRYQQHFSSERMSAGVLAVYEMALTRS